jgi:hypothetical protein
MIETIVETIRQGDVYGRFTVLGTFRENKRIYAKVQCSCGSPIRYVRTDTLRDNTSKSCGCLQIEACTTHGMWKDPIFKAWKNMISRCSDPRNKRYYCYGGQGIKVCERWTVLENFVQDMSDTYKPGLTIDRIDNDGDYEPTNCRWATTAQQNRNYRRNVVLHYNGESMCVVDWALKLNINPKTVYDRIKAGWSDEDALTRPVMLPI